MVEFVILTGVSGAGRSTAAGGLEDLGWFVIDNLPTALIVKVAELAMDPGSSRDRVVLVIGRDTDQLEELSEAVAELRRRGVKVRTVFLEASDEALVRRFEGTRRRHPLGREGVMEAIAIERERLAPIRASADVLVDTTDLNVNQLRDRMMDLFVGERSGALRLSVVSFGFKYGLPIDVDNVFDVRFLPNPHWVPELRDPDGREPAVRDYVLGQPGAVEFADRVDDLLEFLIPSYVREGKSYMSVAVGCTGGKHRSVVVAEEIAGRIRAHGYEAAVFHRDIKK